MKTPQLKPLHLTCLLGFTLATAHKLHAQVIISDLNIFHTDSSGEFAPDEYWNTEGAAVDGSTVYNLWADNQTESGSIPLNGPTDAQAAISFSLAPGVYHIGLRGEPGFGAGFHGMNMFFNGSSTPGISVFAPTTTDLNAIPGFNADSSADTFGTNPFSNFHVPGSGTLTTTVGGHSVTLIGFYWTGLNPAPGFNSQDLVSAFDRSPSGSNDLYGQIDFVVTAVPEPTTYAVVAGAGLLAFAAWRRRA